MCMAHMEVEIKLKIIVGDAQMKKQQGFTLVEIMIVVAIIGLLAAIAIPSFMKARTTSQAKACINNLRQIESAKEQWALAAGMAQGTDIGDSSTTQVSTNRTAVNQYLKLQATGAGTNGPVCAVTDAKYDYQYIGTNATCSVGSNGTTSAADSAAWHILP